MGKVITKKFGVKNILFIERLNGTTYYHAQISVTEDNKRFRVDGIIDANGKEIVPFGKLNLLKEIRVINSNTFIVDFISLIGDSCVCNDVYGSKLYQVVNNDLHLLCESSARTIKMVDDGVVGANFTIPSVTADDWASSPVREFTYDINKHLVTKSRVVGYSESSASPVAKQLIMK